MPYATGVHRVEEILRLADVLGIARVPDLVCPRARDLDQLPAGDYAVIHAAPMFRYKQWTTNGWRELAAALAARGLSVIATGGPAETERRYLDEVWDGARRCAASMASSIGRSSPGCCRRRASISAPTRR